MKRDTLLERIRLEKNALQNAKKTNRAISPVEADEQPWELPLSWRYARLGNICSQIADIDHKMPKAVAQPIAGVSVQGSVWKRCCPYQQDKATTNEKGGFFLEHGSTVIHFSKPDLQPLAFVVKPGTSQVRVVMGPVENQLTVPACVQPDSAHKLVGWGKYGLHFAVPNAGVQVLGGNPDEDYVRYVIKPDKENSYLNLWFGPYAISTEPDDERFVESIDFSQRNLATNKGVIGMDSRGQARNGLNWRQTAAFGSGAGYRDVAKESAALFDKIIDSICWTDYPAR